MTIINNNPSWAVTEFADAELGDIRRTQRLIEIATVLAQQPSASFPQAAAQPAMLKATYRFFDNTAIEPDDILASHVQATSHRLTDGTGGTGYHRTGLDTSPPNRRSRTALWQKPARPFGSHHACDDARTGAIRTHRPTSLGKRSSASRQKSDAEKPSN